MGLATARLLARSGAHISLADVNSTALANAVKLLDGELHHHMHSTVDVTQANAVNEWIEATKSRFGRLDGAVNMAGIINVGIVRYTSSH